MKVLFGSAFGHVYDARRHTCDVFALISSLMANRMFMKFINLAWRDQILINSNDFIEKASEVRF